MKIVRKKYKDGLYYVGMLEGKRVAWRRVKGNKNAKKQVNDILKFTNKVKPKITLLRNVKEADYRKVPKQLGKRKFMFIGEYEVYKNGKLVGRYDASTNASMSKDITSLENESKRNAMLRAVVDNEEYEAYRNSIVPSGYTAKMVKKPIYRTWYDKSKQIPLR